MNGEIKARISGMKIVEAYDASGEVIAWSGVPAEMLERFTEWEICELYKRQTGAETCKVY